MPTTQQPLSSVLDDGDYGGEEAFYGSLEDLQYVNRTPQACPLRNSLCRRFLTTDGDYGGEEAFRQPGGPAA